MANETNHLSFVEYDMGYDELISGHEVPRKRVETISNNNFSTYKETADLSESRVYVEHSRKDESGRLILQLTKGSGETTIFKLEDKLQIGMFLEGLGAKYAEELNGRQIQAYFDEKGIRGVSTYCYDKTNDYDENNESELTYENDENLEGLVGREKTSEEKSFVYRTKTGKDLTEKDMVAMKISESMVLFREEILGILESQRNEDLEGLSLTDFLSLRNEFVKNVGAINELNKEYRALKKQDHPLFNECLDQIAEVIQTYKTLIGEK